MWFIGCIVVRNFLVLYRIHVKDEYLIIEMGYNIYWSSVSVLNLFSSLLLSKRLSLVGGP